MEVVGSRGSLQLCRFERAGKKAEAKEEHEQRKDKTTVALLSLACSNSFNPEN